MSASAIRHRQDGTTEPLAVYTISDTQWAVFCELLPGEGIDLDIGRPFLPGHMHHTASGLDSCNVAIVYTLKEPA